MPPDCPLFAMGSRSFVALILLLCAVHVWGGTATAQQRPVLPSTQHSTLQTQSDLAPAVLPPVDVETLRAEDKDRADEITPYRYGTVVDTDYRPDTHGTWEELPSGDRLWRLRIRSEDAVSLSLGFSRFELPDGASLFVYDPDGDLIRGPYTQADATNGEHWTPLVRGEEIIVEVEAPADQRSALNLVIGSVVHGYRPLFPDRNSPSSKAGTCNLDVACDEADPWRDQVHSVGRYSFVRDNEASVCSGSLVNNTAKDGRPLFLTAEHCVTGPDVATTMTFYWNYQNPTCRTPGTEENGQVTSDNLDDQTSSGAVLRARYGSFHETRTIEGKSDLSLVEIDDSIPKEYNLYLSGWNRQNQSTPEATTIHHPQGHGKRISFDQDPSEITGYAQSNGGSTHLRIGNWETGTTEGGSSGSPLYEPDQHVVGVLSGGRAGCISGTAEDNDKSDWYGRLADGFDKGDYQGRLISEVLDPENTGTQTLDGQPVIPPPPVSNFRVATVTDNSATLRWEAPEEDNLAPAPAEYDLRRAKLPIETSSEFENARRISENVPSPSPAGTTQEVTVDLAPDTSYYFAIRTLDQNKNASPFVASKDASPVSNLRVTRKPGPNPTSGRMKVGFSAEEAQSIRVHLFDTMGQRVRTLFDDKVQPFRQRTVTAQLSSLASGMYFLRIRGESTVRTAKIVVTR